MAQSVFFLPKRIAKAKQPKEVTLKLKDLENEYSCLKKILKKNSGFTQKLNVCVNCDLYLGDKNSSDNLFSYKNPLHTAKAKRSLLKSVFVEREAFEGMNKHRVTFF